MKKFFSGKGSVLGVSPAIVFLVVFFVAPFLVLLYYSLLTIEQGDIVAGPSFDKYVELLTDPFIYYLFGRTIGLSFLVTVLCVLFGYPVAYLHSKIRNPVIKTLILVIVSAPLLTSSLVLSFGWIVILGKRGLANELLLTLGLIDDPVKILFTMRAVIISLTQVMLPFMIVPLISTLQKLPQDLEDASADLGANKWQTFWRVTIPQSIPSIAAGMSLVFVLTYTAFTVPSLTGGSAMQIVSVYIWNNIRLLTWDTAAAISSLLLLTSLIIITVFNIIVRKLTPWN
ncbi:MAG: ABC transporter permease [Candidatus Promineifilaceae bacterium]|nr:ABC transporter permease [Candidatus Promineifilaceae bacterium]